MSGAELVRFAVESLPRMQLTSGRFCHEVERGDPVPRGSSTRYSLMVLLGLLKADAAGVEQPFDLEALQAVLWQDVDEPELASGDFGLYLWVDARTGFRRSEELVARLERKLAAAGGLPACEGMEIGWIVTGLALQHAALGTDRTRRLLDDALDQLLTSNQARSGLFFHTGAGRRRRFPNFATQIYGILALATVAKLGLDARALPAARRAADAILATQLPDGGWPWLFDAETGRVVERYEIYSVHQDAMAPMGLFELSEASGDARYARAALHGLDWLDGRNELGAGFVLRDDGMIYRSIRRRRGLDRLCLYANTLAAATAGRAPARAGRVLELNPTDRPYHLGWILEAWCGREEVTHDDALEGDLEDQRSAARA